ncbi:hypothetical protein HNY73_021453 [Argiope bruennichi]|uniref:Uncharacterized protein n=1 Tax=Argiope bruennichi TaxID=94029 RepID=A0A8T0DZZ2_ARGBR|nr:hypothetical protein HNY73_021453 [Argiope bruennichi]
MWSYKDDMLQNQLSYQDCPANKTYGSFGDCPMSCYLLTPRDPEPCTMRLNWGCKCQEGYVLLEHKVFSSNALNRKTVLLNPKMTQLLLKVSTMTQRRQ